MNSKSIYVVRCRFLFKIGSAKHVPIRIAALRCGNPFPVELVLDIPSQHPLRDERRWHRKFHTKRVNGEWFRLTKEDLELIRTTTPGDSPRIRNPRKPRPIQSIAAKQFEKHKEPEDWRRELELLDWCIDWVATHQTISI